METTTQIQGFTRLLVTELIEAIARQERTDWVLEQDTAGLLAGTHFRSREELILAVTRAYVERLAPLAGIKAA